MGIKDRTEKGPCNLVMKDGKVVTVAQSKREDIEPMEITHKRLMAMCQYIAAKSSTGFDDVMNALGMSAGLTNSNGKLYLLYGPGMCMNFKYFPREVASLVSAKLKVAEEKYFGTTNKIKDENKANPGFRAEYKAARDDLKELVKQVTYVKDKEGVITPVTAQQFLCKYKLIEIKLQQSSSIDKRKEMIYDAMMVKNKLAKAESVNVASMIELIDGNVSAANAATLDAEALSEHMKKVGIASSSHS